MTDNIYHKLRQQPTLFTARISPKSLPRESRQARQGQEAGCGRGGLQLPEVQEVQDKPGFVPSSLFVLQLGVVDGGPGAELRVAAGPE